MAISIHKCNPKPLYFELTTGKGSKKSAYRQFAEATAVSEFSLKCQQ